MNSREYKEIVKEKLREIGHEIDGMYDKMWVEINNEINLRKEQREKVARKSEEVVSKLSLEICDKILRKKLPLRVRLLNKVECMGYGSTGVGQVMIYFNLNNDINSYQYIISSQEINKLLAKI